MRLTRILVGAIAALALVPASALGQAPADLGDHYLAPIFLPSSIRAASGLAIRSRLRDPGHQRLHDRRRAGRLRRRPEFNQCQIGGRTSNYGKTVWSAFHADRYGRLDVTATGFDAVIGLVSVQEPRETRRRPRSTAATASAARSSPSRATTCPPSQKGGWYALQVGGFLDPATGQFAGGGLQVERRAPEARADRRRRRHHLGLAQGRRDDQADPRRSAPTDRSPASSAPRSRAAVRRSGTRSRSASSRSRSSTRRPTPVRAEHAEAEGRQEARRPEMLAKNVFKNKKVKNGARLRRRSSSAATTRSARRSSGTSRTTRPAPSRSAASSPTARPVRPSGSVTASER